MLCTGPLTNTEGGCPGGRHIWGFPRCIHVGLYSNIPDCCDIIETQLHNILDTRKWTSHVHTHTHTHMDSWSVCRLHWISFPEDRWAPIYHVYIAVRKPCRKYGTAPGVYAYIVFGLGPWKPYVYFCSLFRWLCTFVLMLLLDLVEGKPNSYSSYACVPRVWNNRVQLNSTWMFRDLVLS